MATGAHDFVRPPPPSTPHSSSIRFPRGLAARGKTRAEPRCDACGETFQIGPNTQVRMVRKRGTERTALAFQRSAQVGIGTTYNGMRRRSAVGAGWESVHIQRSLRWMSRSDGNWGPRFCSTAPAQHPPLLLHQISPWAGRSGEDESRAEVRCVRENFSNRAQHAGADGEEAADGRKCDGGRASGPGSKSVHRKRSLGGMSRADVRWGPRFSSTAPGRDPHPLLHQISPWAGRAATYD